MTKYPGRAAATSSIFPIWIAIDCEVVPKRYPFLFRIQISGTKEAGPFCDRLSVHGRGRARHAMRNVTDEHVEPVNAHRAGLGMRETVNTSREPWPFLKLAFKELFNLK